MTMIICHLLIHTDINECTNATDNCSAVATCMDTDGSYICTCITGYSGDGVTCEGKIFLELAKIALMVSLHFRY